MSWIDERNQPRPKTLELLQRPARRRHELWRLRRAAYLFAVPEDGRRALAPTVQPAEPDSRAIRLAVAASTRRRRAVRPLSPRARSTGQREGHARAYLQQGAEQVSGPGQAAARDSRTHQR